MTERMPATLGPAALSVLVRAQAPMQSGENCGKTTPKAADRLAIRSFEIEGQRIAWLAGWRIQ